MKKILILSILVFAAPFVFACESMPLTKNGKTDRKRLKESYESSSD